MYLHVICIKDLFSFKTNGTILDHQLIVSASQFTPLDEEHIPTGEFICIIDDNRCLF